MKRKKKKPKLNVKKKREVARRLEEETHVDSGFVRAFFPGRGQKHNDENA
jgi:hypothetical protein